MRITTMKPFSNHYNNLAGRRSRKPARFLVILAFCVLVSLLISACDSSTQPPSTQSTQTTTSTGGPSFPTSPPALRVPTFGASGQEAPTVKILSSVAPSLIVQFPLVPSGIKALFPHATALVTVVEDDPAISVFDTVTVDVANMPPLVKFTVFFTELSAKPFGHAEYVGDVYTRSDGTGE